MSGDPSGGMRKGPPRRDNRLMDSVAELASRLKRARAERGMSIRDLCEASGVTSTSVAWRAENGRDVAFSVAAKLAAALGVSLDGTTEPPPGSCPDGGSESAGGG